MATRSLSVGEFASRADGNLPLITVAVPGAFRRIRETMSACACLCWGNRQ
jgi:hypothetical protein